MCVCLSSMCEIITGKKLSYTLVVVYVASPPLEEFKPRIELCNCVEVQ